MAETDDVGRILDFTRASPWEEFVGALEEALRAPSNGAGAARLETRVPLPGGGGMFVLVDHRLGPTASDVSVSAPAYMAQMLARGDGAFRLDGRFGTERIRRWFGVHEYAVLFPEDGRELDSAEIAFAQVRYRGPGKMLHRYIQVHFTRLYRRRVWSVSGKRHEFEGGALSRTARLRGRHMSSLASSACRCFLCTGCAQSCSRPKWPPHPWPALPLPRARRLYRLGELRAVVDAVRRRLL